MSQTDVAIQVGPVGIFYFGGSSAIQVKYIGCVGAVDAGAVEFQTKRGGIQSPQGHAGPNFDILIGDQIGKVKSFGKSIFTGYPKMGAKPHATRATHTVGVAFPGFKQVDLVFFQPGIIVKNSAGVSRVAKRILATDTQTSLSCYFDKIIVSGIVNGFAQVKTLTAGLVIPAVGTFSIKEDVIAGIKFAIVFTHNQNMVFNQIVNPCFVYPHGQHASALAQ